ncbi:MAG TPA: hypothetical protein VN864_06300 [Thermoplasmata archaeon]|nr:hypothetical protein [Thermoplasmata archaeon]
MSCPYEVTMEASADSAVWRLFVDPRVIRPFVSVSARPVSSRWLGTVCLAVEGSPRRKNRTPR